MKLFFAAIAFSASRMELTPIWPTEDTRSLWCRSFRRLFSTLARTAMPPTLRRTASLDRWLWAVSAFVDDAKRNGVTETAMPAFKASLGDRAYHCRCRR